MTAARRAAAGPGLLAEVALAGCLAGVTAFVYTAFYPGWSFAGPVVGAAALATLGVAAAARAGWPTGRTAVASLASLALYAVWAVYPAETNGGLPGPAAWSALAGGLSGAWAEMLTVGLPADPRGDLLVVPVVLTWVSAAGAGLLCRGTSSPLAPLVPPGLALVAGLGLVAAGGGSHLPVIGAFLAVAVALVLLRTSRLAVGAAVAGNASGATAIGGETAGTEADGEAEDAEPAERDVVVRATAGGRGRRRLAAGHAAIGAPVVAVLALVGPLAALAVPLADGDRFDPRDLRDQRIEIDDTISPLGSLKRQLSAASPRDLFRVEVDSLPPGVDRVRTAVLDTYDGARWTSTAEYRRAGDDLPADPLGLGPGASPRPVRMTVTVDRLDGPFLPTLGRPVGLDAAGAGFDSAGGTLVHPDGDLEGYRYEVRSDVGALAVVADEDDLVGASAAAGPSLDPYRTPPPELPDELRDIALLWAAEADTHAGELLRLRDHLRALPYDDSADTPPGHSYRALLRLVTGDADEQGGYAEQLATAFAVLARERGFATRLVVGYLLPQAGEDGSYTVTEAQAHVWPEVALEGRGWVVVEPTDLSAIGRPNDAEEAPPVIEDEPQAGDTPAETPAEPRVVVGGEGGSGSGGGVPVEEGLAMGGLVLAAVVFAIPLGSVLAKARRRRRRRTSGDGADQVVGAWRETVDLLAGNGVEVGDAHTTDEVASLAAERFEGAAESVGPLAGLASQALYAEVVPGDDWARQAWQWERAARAELRAVVGPWRQARAWVDPRPLLTRRHG